MYNETHGLTLSLEGRASPLAPLSSELAAALVRVVQLHPAERLQPANPRSGHAYTHVHSTHPIPDPHPFGYPSAAALPSATPQVVLPSPTPTVTPTPHTYKIASGDTLGGLALRFGISLPALQTANPKVDPPCWWSAPPW